MSTWCLRGGRVVDPTNGIDEVRDLAVRDGCIVELDTRETFDEEIDVSGCVVMAGGIDMHTHIGGGKINLARLLMPEDHRTGGNPYGLPANALELASCGTCTPGTLATGYRYVEMGYTAAFEPAMMACNARHTHMEMGDTPILDHGAYVMLGNDELFLEMLSRGEDFQRMRDYMAWTIRASKAMGVKVVNPGGISAFKFNQRKLDVDEPHTHWQVTPRQVVHTLARALRELGVPHPLHIHGSNLGVAGNIESTLETIAALEGLPGHLTHIQFHAYGREGPKKFSSAAVQLADAVNANPNVSIDVGQIMFGQTVTASGDTMRQYAQSGLADPRKWIGADIECEAGCGVVPFRYREQSYVNALQWAIGLEIFLLVNDPWRVVLTTDHPNGGPFTSYPHLIRLLMDRSFRDEQLAKLHPDVAAHAAPACSGSRIAGIWVWERQPTLPSTETKRIERLCLPRRNMSSRMACWWRKAGVSRPCRWAVPTSSSRSTTAASKRFCASILPRTARSISTTWRSDTMSCAPVAMAAGCCPQPVSKARHECRADPERRAHR